MNKDNRLAQQLFSDLPDEALQALQSAAKFIQVARGEHIIKQGETAQNLYFIESGRFKIVVDGTRTVAHLDSGEVVGELAFFAGGKRTADVIANRDSTVLKVTREDYNKISEQHPQLPQVLLKLVSERLAQSTQRTTAIQGRLPRVIGFMPIGEHSIPSDFLDRLARSVQTTLAEQDSVLIVNSQSVGNISNYPEWLAQKEKESALVLVDCRGDEQWSQQASRNVDALLLVAHSESQKTQMANSERTASELLAPQYKQLVLVRDHTDSAIKPSAAWLDQRDLDLHHHLALDNEWDFARVARFVCGCAQGLVLAGGGALGCAHLGAIQALQDANIAIDFIGGTSAGAAMAGAVATGQSIAETLDQMEIMFIESGALKKLTLPVHSLLDPSEFDHQLETRYGTTDIADLPLNFFAVSTNLSTSSQHVHRRGPLWEAVRASGSLPTILPPFIDSEGQILVDGGVLDNLPVATMQSIKPGPNIAITLDALDSQWFSEAHYHQNRSRGALLRDLVLRRKPEAKFPSLFETTQRSMVVSSRMASKQIDEQSTTIITAPKIEGMQILDWHRGRELAEKTRDQVAKQIESGELVFP